MTETAAGGVSVLHQFGFRAMNTDIDISFVCAEEDVRSLDMRARGWFQNVETAFSRFWPGSELCRLNRSAGRRALVSENMLEVLLLAEKYREETAGAFNPFLLTALRNAGYDVSFEYMGGTKPQSLEAPARPLANAAHPIEFDAGMKAVRLSPGTEADLGGIAKSWAVKRLAHWMQHQRKLKQGMVNAGGDLTVWDHRKRSSQPWLVGVEHPWRPESDAGVLAMANGAAATSSKLGRRWLTERGPMHHLIDPRTLLPSESDTVQCTVAGPDVTACEAWAKALCILGSEEGLPRFREKAPAYEALLFTDRKQTIFAGTGGSPVCEWRGIAFDRVYGTDS
ncbi:FAD:protein FMN transferase [Paenibacillus sp. MBLB4367]|uniref:FAD:protein FMN transferase n=1 Tax=Paenibacillus sp. MBLB4367 TaxID=3384767 RepID=UPI0039083A35